VTPVPAASQQIRGALLVVAGLVIANRRRAGR
jgi:hypothetical protein